MSFSKAITALILAAASLGAQAAPVSVTSSQTKAQTVAGQDFTFTFDNLSSNFTGVGSLTLTARGDYSPFDWLQDEYLSVSFDGVIQGNFGYWDGSARTLYTNDDTEWTRVFSFDHNTLAKYLKDGKLVVNVNLSGDVGHFASTDAITTSFNYSPAAALPSNSVPEPDSLLLIAGALAGVLVARRRARSV